MYSDQVAEAFKYAAEYGLLGLAVLILSIALRVLYAHSRTDRVAHTALIAAKDTQLGEMTTKLCDEQHMRVEDAKRFTEVALKLQGEVISSVASIERASTENAKLCKFVERLVDTVESLLEEQRRNPALRKR